MSAYSIFGIVMSVLIFLLVVFTLVAPAKYAVIPLNWFGNAVEWVFGPIIKFFKKK